MLFDSTKKKDEADDGLSGASAINIILMLAVLLFTGYLLTGQTNVPIELSFTKINETTLENGTWIQEIFNENGFLYSVACTRDLEPRLYKHTSPTNRTFIKKLCEAPDRYYFHKGLAVTRVDNITFAFVNIHVFEKTLTACYSGDSIENLEYIGLASQAGYFPNTTMNFRIRDVWFNTTDQLFYAYYDGSDLGKGTHYYTYLGRSPDPFFDPEEFEYLYCAGNGWNEGGLYAPNVLWLDEYGIGCVKGYKNPVKPYDFDSDLVYIEKPSNVQFFTNLRALQGFFSKYLNDETQASFLFTYNEKIYLASRHGEYQISEIFGIIYEVEIKKN